MRDMPARRTRTAVEAQRGKERQGGLATRGKAAGAIICFATAIGAALCLYDNGPQQKHRYDSHEAHFAIAGILDERSDDDSMHGGTATGVGFRHDGTSASDPGELGRGVHHSWGRQRPRHLNALGRHDGTGDATERPRRRVGLGQSRGNLKRHMGEIRRLREALELEYLINMTMTARDACNFTENLSYADLMEGFAGEATLSRCAREEGLHVLQPAGIRDGWDLASVDGQDKLFATIDRLKRKLVVMGFPCMPWCSFRRRPDALRAIQNSDRPLLRLVRDTARMQAQSGRYFVVENPPTSQAWREIEIMDSFDLPNMHTGIGDMCAFVRASDDGVPIKKAMRFATIDETLLSSITQRCPGPGDHPTHQRVEGRHTNKTRSTPSSSPTPW